MTKKKWLVTIEEKTEYHIEVEGETVADAIHNALTSKENRDSIFENAAMTEYSDKVVYVGMNDKWIPEVK